MGGRLRAASVARRASTPTRRVGPSLNCIPVLAQPPSAPLTDPWQPSVPASIPRTPPIVVGRPGTRNARDLRERVTHRQAKSYEQPFQGDGTGSNPVGGAARPPLSFSTNLPFLGSCSRYWMITRGFSLVIGGCGPPRTRCGPKRPCGAALPVPAPAGGDYRLGAVGGTVVVIAGVDEAVAVALRPCPGAGIVHGRRVAREWDAPRTQGPGYLSAACNARQ